MGRNGGIMRCHACREKVSEDTMSVKPFGHIIRLKGMYQKRVSIREVDVLDLLSAQELCPECALFRVSMGERWVRYAEEKEKIIRMKKEVYEVKVPDRDISRVC